MAVRDLSEVINGVWLADRRFWHRHGFENLGFGETTCLREGVVFRKVVSVSKE
jgi:hypothetical protein